VSISPAIAVLEIAPAKVLQGAVRLQGLASSPTPDTQVREAWAWACEAKEKAATKEAAITMRARVIISRISFAKDDGRELGLSR
jgi:hypothetical protein